MYQTPAGWSAVGRLALPNFDGAIMAGRYDAQFVHVEVPDALDMTEKSALASRLLHIPLLQSVIKGTLSRWKSSAIDTSEFWKTRLQRR